MGKAFVRVNVALIVEPATNVALNNSRHTVIIVNASSLTANVWSEGRALSVKGQKKWASLAGRGMIGWISDDVHRQEANYLQVVHVDYLDYDYEDYDRFGRWEKQLAS